MSKNSPMNTKKRWVRRLKRDYEEMRETKKRCVKESYEYKRRCVKVSKKRWVKIELCILRRECAKNEKRLRRNERH